MDSTQLALLALAAGIILGVGVTLIVVLAFRARERALREQSLALDDATAVLDSSGAVVSVSASATWLGLAPGQGLEQPELRELVKAARGLGSSTESQTLRIRRGRISDDTRLGGGAAPARVVHAPTTPARFAATAG